MEPLILFGVTAVLPVPTTVVLLCAWRPSWWRVWVIPPVRDDPSRAPWEANSIGGIWSAAFWGTATGATAGAAVLGVLMWRQRRSDVQTSVR